MTSPQGIDFIEYTYLHELLSQPGSNPPSITELDLSDKEHLNIPPPQILFCFTNLRSLLLNHNHIQRFSAPKLLQGAPLLEHLDLSYNTITILDDLIDLGSSRTLVSLNILGNPVAVQQLRIKIVESLLFPKKFQPYEPLKVLTATYNMCSSNFETERKRNIVVSKSSRSITTSSSTTERPQSKLCRLGHEMCPVPRKTRFPMLSVFNEEIISIVDLQRILMQKEIGSILFEDRSGEENLKTVRFDKLHKGYILAYLKKKTRRLEEEGQPPSLEKLSSMIKSNNNMVLLLAQDRIRYEKRKTMKPDYQGEVWNGPQDRRLKDSEFTIGISQFKEEVRVHDERMEEKKKEQRAYMKKIKSHKDIENSPGRRNKKLQIKKLLGNNKEHFTSTTNSESSVPEQASNIERKSMEAVENSRQEGEEEFNEERESRTPSLVSIGGPVLLSVKGRSNSMSKTMRNTNRSKITREENGQEEESILGNETPHVETLRRTKSMSVASFSRGGSIPNLVLSPVPMSVIGEKPVSGGKREGKTRKRLVAAQESAPNISLPMFSGSVEGRNTRSSSVETGGNITVSLERKNRRHSTSKPQKSEKIINIKSQIIDVRVPVSTPYLEYSKVEQSINSSNYTSNVRGDPLEQHGALKDLPMNEISEIGRMLDGLPAKSSAVSSNKLNSNKVGSESPFDIASLAVTMRGSPIPKENIRDISPIVAGEGVLKCSRGSMGSLFDSSGARTEEKTNFSTPNTTNIHSVNNREVQAKFAGNRLFPRTITITKRVRKVREKEQEALRMSKLNLLSGPNLLPSSAGHNRSFSYITGSKGQQREREVSQARITGFRQQRMQAQEMGGGFSSQSSFLHSQLLKNNNHSLTYVKRMKSGGMSSTKRPCLAVEEDQLEDFNFVVKTKMSGKEETGGLDSTNMLSLATHSSSKKYKTRSHSVGRLVNIPNTIGIVGVKLGNPRAKEKAVF